MGAVRTAEGSLLDRCSVNLSSSSSHMVSCTRLTSRVLLVAPRGMVIVFVVSE